MYIWFSYTPSAIDGPSYSTMVCYCGESGQGIKYTEVISYHIAFLIYPLFDAMICTYRILKCGYIITSKCLPHFWFFVRGIHKWPIDFPYKGPVMQRIDVSVVVSLNKLFKLNSPLASEMRCISMIYFLLDEFQQLVLFLITGKVKHTIFQKSSIHKQLMFTNYFKDNYTACPGCFPPTHYITAIFSLHGNVVLMKSISLYWQYRVCSLKKSNTKMSIKLKILQCHLYQKSRKWQI